MKCQSFFFFWEKYGKKIKMLSAEFLPCKELRSWTQILAIYTNYESSIVSGLGIHRNSEGLDQSSILMVQL